METITEEKRNQGNITLGEKEEKILGMFWNAETDKLGFNTSMLRVPQDVREAKRAPTKREALSAIMSIYDPLGLIAQYTITAKILLQEVWTMAIDWDEPLPHEEAQKFADWLGALEEIARLRIPRHYFPAGGDKHSLHVFADASSQAYSTVAYWRTEHTSGISVTIIAGKSRVSPLKPLSIPRLELQAALIASRLMNKIIKEHRIKPENIYLWTDSKTVLQWVRTDARRYNTYVSHRLAEISESTSVKMWRWVPTAQNPADDGTRADPKKKIYASDRWYTGPDFLKYDEEQWPQETEKSTLEPDELEMKKEKINCHATTERHEPLPDITRFSRYERLIGATARVLQFVQMLKEKKRVAKKIEHVIAAEKLWLQWAQRRDFPEELRQLSRGEPLDHRSRLFKLDPVIGEDGVLRVRGRIDATPADINKRPPILDGSNPYVRLIIKQAHERAHHSGNEQRPKYGILDTETTASSTSRRLRVQSMRATPS